MSCFLSSTAFVASRDYHANDDTPTARAAATAAPIKPMPDVAASAPAPLSLFVLRTLVFGSPSERTARESPQTPSDCASESDRKTWRQHQFSIPRCID